MSEKIPAAPQSDLITRFAAGVVMIAAACTAIYVGGWLFRLLVAAGAAVMILEWGDMHRLKRGYSYFALILLALTLLGAAEYLYPLSEAEDPIMASTFYEGWRGFVAIAAAAALAALVSRSPTLGWGMLYVGIPSFALLVIEWARFDLVFWLMLVTWATDIFAYFAGRSIGGPKLAPRISPNKTWAGLIGGMAGAAVVGAVAAWLFGLSAEVPAFLWLGAPMGLLAQLGDLYESSVKRRRGVKDSGTLLPGHGGVLDRLDGLLPVILATFLILIAVLP
ncbi:MAG: phosphatidate cytidylyltransferase [Sphingomonadales bacterium]|jgi:phosphatidate cytidylyltransferase|nr:phosphatidate cytidylyltransferase [Sphingomonadales bacterium]